MSEDQSATAELKRATLETAQLDSAQKYKLYVAQQTDSMKVSL